MVKIYDYSSRFNESDDKSAVSLLEIVYVNIFSVIKGIYIMAYMSVILQLGHEMLNHLMFRESNTICRLIIIFLLL